MQWQIDTNRLEQNTDYKGTHDNIIMEDSSSHTMTQSLCSISNRKLLQELTWSLRILPSVCNGLARKKSLLNLKEKSKATLFVSFS